MRRFLKMTGVIVVWVYLLASGLAMAQGLPSITNSGNRRNDSRFRGIERQFAYTSGTVTVDILLQAVPEVNNLAVIKGEQISEIGSGNESWRLAKKLAKRINELLASDECDDIVIARNRVRWKKPPTF